MPELISGILLKASAETLSGPFIYFIVGLYYYNSKCQLRTLSIVKFSKLRFLWSIYIVIHFSIIYSGTLLVFPLYSTVLILYSFN